MQILITTSALSRTRVMQFTPLTLVLGALALFLPTMILSVLLYHAVVIKAAQEHWPIISQAVRFVERQELAQRDRFMRENLDAMAQKVGDLQAKLLRIEAVSERVAGMAGMKPEDLRQIEAPSKGPSGGPLVTLQEGAQASRLTIEALDKQMADLDVLNDRHTDVFTLIESRLFEKRLEARLIPSTPPVIGPVGSGFGFRSDPFTRRTALHTGLDFAADSGTPIVAAAGGVVLSASLHPQYGQLVELDHGNGLVTRYAHASRILVKQGDLVRRGQPIAEVGSTGRSTGPHLHFEVLLEGVQQNPAKFLASPGASAQNAKVASVK